MMLRWLGVVGVALLLSAAAPLPREPIIGRATISDGDTLRIGRERIRLFGIDAPEMNQSCNDDRGARYPCGEVARDELRRHVGNAPVMCVPVDRDQYQRVVARCYLGNEDLNRWIVFAGWAIAYKEFSRAYVPDEEAAHAGRRGMWNGEFMLPSLWRRQERRAR
jgi:endonuclease YncB( thermonuclease family)